MIQILNKYFPPEGSEQQKRGSILNVILFIKQHKNRTYKK